MRVKDKNEEKNVIVEVEYGNIKVKLDEILNERGISTYELSSRANVRFQTIKALRNNTASRIDFEVLAKMIKKNRVIFHSVFLFITLKWFQLFKEFDYFHP